MPSDRHARFELQGHRGARTLFPENTLEGIVATLALGVHAIELDIAVTADDVAVVTHDTALNPDLMRGPDGAFLAGRGPSLRSLPAAALAGYDVGRLRPGSAAAARFPLQAGCDGLRIPSLEAVLRATAGCKASFAVEIKTGADGSGETAAPEAMVDVMLGVADALGARARLVPRSFDWRCLSHLRRRAPDMALVWLSEGADRATLDAVVAAAAGSRSPGWAPGEAALGPEVIAAAQAAGLLVLPWTVNEPGRMAELIGWGVDGVCTDDPVMGRRVVAAAGIGLADGWFKKESLLF